MSFKQQLIETSSRYLTEKINALHAIMEEIRDSANADAKSSAGDKHETAKAMMHLEQEKLGKQLNELIDLKTEFDKIDFTKLSQQTGQGSFIKTDKGLFFIAVPLGKLEVNGNTVYVISRQAPLAIALSGKQQQDHIFFNNITYTILSVE